MKPIIRIGKLRLFVFNNWKDQTEFNIDFFSINADLKYKYICIYILNFEFQINW